MELLTRALEAHRAGDPAGVEAALESARFEIVDPRTGLWWVTTAALCNRASASEVLEAYRPLAGDEDACVAVAAVVEHWASLRNDAALTIASELARTGPGTRFKVLSLRTHAALTARVDPGLVGSMPPRAVERAVLWLSERGERAGVAAIREALPAPDARLDAARIWLELREPARAARVAEHLAALPEHAALAAEIAGRAELEMGRIAAAVSWVERCKDAPRARLEARIWPERERWERAAELSAKDPSSRGEEVAEAAWRSWSLGAPADAVGAWVRAALDRGVSEASRVVLAEVLAETGDERGGAEVLAASSSTAVRLQAAALLVRAGDTEAAAAVLESVGREARTARELYTAAEALARLGRRPTGLLVAAIRAGSGSSRDQEFVLAAAGLLWSMVEPDGSGGRATADALVAAARVGVAWKASGTLEWLETACRLGASEALDVLGVLRGDMWMGGWAALTLARCAARAGRSVEAAQWRLEALRRGRDIGDEALEAAAAAALAG